MESKRPIVCEIIDKGLTVLNDPKKLAAATPSQITTALGTLIDKWTDNKQTNSDRQSEDDPITKTLKEEAKNGLL